MPERIGYLIKRGSLIINTRSYTVTLKGKEIDLLHKEFRILCLLAQHPGWVFTKEEIYKAVYEEDIFTDIDNMIFCLIYGLRKKLELDLKHPQYIKTVWGVGYKFVEVN